MKEPEEVHWSPVVVVEGLSRGKLYRIEKPHSKDEAVNVYCDGKFIGPAHSVSDAKDSIERGLC